MSVGELYLQRDTLITSKTDLRGRITYGNEDFKSFSGYTEREFLHKPHSIMRHADMPKITFKLLWEALKEGKEFFGFIKNRSKNNQFYWVYANITPSVSENSTPIGYYSVRRMPNRKAVQEIQAIYKHLHTLEQKSGLEASLKFFKDFLNKEKLCYEEFIAKLQNL